MVCVAGPAASRRFRRNFPYLPLDRCPRRSPTPTQFPRPSDLAGSAATLPASFFSVFRRAKNRCNRPGWGYDCFSELEFAPGDPVMRFRLFTLCRRLLLLLPLVALSAALSAGPEKQP